MDIWCDSDCKYYPRSSGDRRCRNKKKPRRDLLWINCMYRRDTLFSRLLRLLEGR